MVFVLHWLPFSCGNRSQISLCLSLGLSLYISFSLSLSLPLCPDQQSEECICVCLSPPPQVLVLPRVTEGPLSLGLQSCDSGSMEQEVPRIDPKPLTSNVYSTWERRLLTWLNLHYHSMRTTVWSPLTSTGRRGVLRKRQGGRDREVETGR